MPISTDDLQYLGKVSLDEYIRNQVTDNVSINTPLLKQLMSKKKKLIGGRQNVVENIRKSTDSNFAWTYGESPVSFSKRKTTDQVFYAWKVAVDGFYITTDYLFGNGIKVREGGRAAYKMEKSEKVQLIDLLDEQMEAFMIGFNEKLDLELHRNGTSSADAVMGLDALVSLNPTTGIVGGIDRATATYWRNNAITGVQSTSPGELARALEKQWRACHKNGGAPDFILAGADFIDAYAQYAVTVTNNADASKPKRIDAGIGTGVKTGLYFKGVELIWDPQFETLDSLETPTTPWAKRCYFLNTKDLKLRDDGAEVNSRTPPHDVRALFQMAEVRTVLTMTRSNAHAVTSIA